MNSKLAPTLCEMDAKPSSRRHCYTVEQLRLLNHGQGSPQGPWPEQVFLCDSPPDTPCADEQVWSVSNTPFTAPARIHQRDESQQQAPMTPMRAKTPSTKVKTQETDKRRLGQRAKQVLYGKSTLGYRMCRILSATDEHVSKKFVVVCCVFFKIFCRFRKICLGLLGSLKSAASGAGTRRCASGA